MSFGRNLAALAFSVPLLFGAVGCTQQEKDSYNKLISTELETKTTSSQVSGSETVQAEILKSQLFDQSGNPKPEALGNAIDLEHIYLYRNNDTPSEQKEVTLLTDYLIRMKQPINASRTAFKIKDEHERARVALELIAENSVKARELGNTVTDFSESYKILEGLMNQGHAKDAVYFFGHNPERFSGMDDNSRLSVLDYFLKEGYVMFARENAQGLSNEDKVKFAKTLVDSGNSRNAVYLAETIKIGPNYENQNFVDEVKNYMIDKWTESGSVKLRTDFKLLMDYIQNGTIAEDLYK